MADYRVYLVGFHDSDLTGDEQAKLDEHISKHNPGWSKDPYKPIDKRDPGFKNVADTFADEGPRADGKHIIIFQELVIEGDSEKDKFFAAFKEIKEALSNVVFEAHDDSKRIG